jgi:hypothetical protein
MDVDESSTPTDTPSVNADRPAVTSYRSVVVRQPSPGNTALPPKNNCAPNQTSVSDPGTFNQTRSSHEEKVEEVEEYVNRVDGPQYIDSGSREISNEDVAGESGKPRKVRPATKPGALEVSSLSEKASSMDLRGSVVGLQSITAGARIISSVRKDSKAGRRSRSATMPGAVAVAARASNDECSEDDSEPHIQPPTISPISQDGKIRATAAPGASKPGAVNIVGRVSNEVPSVEDNDDHKVEPSSTFTQDGKEHRGAIKPGAVSISPRTSEQVVSQPKAEPGLQMAGGLAMAPGVQQHKNLHNEAAELLVADDEDNYEDGKDGHHARAASADANDGGEANPAIKPGAVTMRRSDSRDAAFAEMSGPDEQSSGLALAPGRADEDASKSAAPPDNSGTKPPILAGAVRIAGIDGDDQLSRCDARAHVAERQSDAQHDARSTLPVKEESTTMLLTAHLVNEDEDPDMIYKKAHQEAEEVVRRQILGCVVEAHATEVVPENTSKAREDEESEHRVWIFLCLALVFLMVVGAVVGGVVGTRCNREDCDGDKFIIVAAKDECLSAAAIDLNSTYRYFGSLEGTSLDDVDGCDGVEISGPGVWFVVNGRGLPIQASTCDNAVVDTQITVFTGTCGGLQCVGANDDACKQQSSLVWPGAKDETYYVLVTGNDLESADPGFVLLVTETAANDVCETAEPIQLLTMDNVTLSGSTVGATQDNNVPECGSGSDRGPGAWYEVIGGTGLPIRASTCENNRTGGAMATLFSGDCGALQCVEARYEDCEVTWAADENEVYYILVAELSEGPFQLFIAETVANDLCEIAALIPTVNGTVIAGTTLGASIDGFVPQCGQATNSTSPGVWFSIVGNGNIYTVNNCGGYDEFGSFDPFDSQISVFRGDCDSLVCVDGNDDFCETQSLVSWLTLEGQAYLILVHGYWGGSGDFNLTFIEETVDLSDLCEDAIGPLPSGFEIPFTTEIFRGREIQACDLEETIYPGVLFKVRGTGSSLRASTCGSRTDFNTIVSVFVGDGCDQLECVDNAENRFCLSADVPQLSQGLITWETEVDRLYFVLVQGANQQTGSFVLSIEDVIKGDSCEEPVLLEPNGESRFGRTATTLPQDVDSLCGTTLGNAGVWYQVQGTGNEMEASLCSDFTDFDTIVSIFGGSCGNLFCLASNDDDCGQDGYQSRVSWQSEPEETYSILIHGFNNDVGNFELEVSALRRLSVV